MSSDGASAKLLQFAMHVCQLKRLKSHMYERLSVLLPPVAPTSLHPLTLRQAVARFVFRSLFLHVNAIFSRFNALHLNPGEKKPYLTPTPPSPSCLHGQCHAHSLAMCHNSCLLFWRQSRAIAVGCQREFAYLPRDGAS